MVAGSVVVSITDNISKKCAVFDGADDIITIADSDTHNNIFDETGSISAWIYAESSGETGLGTIIEKDSVAGSWIWNVATDVGAFVKMRFLQRAATTTGTWNSAAGAIPKRTLTHVVLTYDNTNAANAPVFYVNGALSATTETQARVGARLTDAGQPIDLGNSSVKSRTFDGAITDIRYFRHTLTTAEITTLYQGGNVFTGLISVWNFRDGSYNDSYGANNGTNDGTYITIMEDQIRTQISSQRVTANDKYMCAGLIGGQLVFVSVEET